MFLYWKTRKKKADYNEFFYSVVLTLKTAWIAMRIVILQMRWLQGWVQLNWMNEFVYLHLTIFAEGRSHLSAGLRGWWQASYWVGVKFQHDLHLFLLFRCLAFSHLFLFFYECTLTLTHTHTYRVIISNPPNGAPMTP